MQALSQKPTPGHARAVSPFVRPASGLVREITAWQVFGFNVMNANIGIGLVWLTLLGPGLYPGANLYLAVLLAFVGILPLNLLYVRLAVAFPRSGGDYVSISRTLSPALGFAVNAAAMAYFCLFVGPRRALHRAVRPDAARPGRGPPTAARPGRATWPTGSARRPAPSSSRSPCWPPTRCS